MVMNHLEGVTFYMRKVVFPTVSWGQLYGFSIFLYSVINKTNFWLLLCRKVVVFFRLLFKRPMGGKASINYLQLEAAKQTWGNVEINSIQYLENVPGKPSLTHKKGYVGLPDFVISQALQKCIKTEEMSD